MEPEMVVVGQSDLRRSRIAVLITALAYPAWCSIHHYVNPEVQDPYMGRAAIGLLLCALIAISYGRNLAPILALRILQSSRWILTVHYSYLMYVNRLETSYVVAAYFFFITVASFFSSRKTFLLFALTVVSLCAVCATNSANAQFPGFAFAASMVYCALISYMGLAVRLKLVESLRESLIAQRQVERKLVEQQEAMLHASKMTALGEMAGGIAHEINTPLAIISLAVEDMQEHLEEKNPVDHERMRRRIEMVDKTIQRIAKVVSGLRFFAREGPDDPPELTPVSELIEQTLALCQEKFANAGVRLDVSRNSAYQNLQIHCRAVEISQVLLNLLSNAFDAVADGEEPWIRLVTFDQGSHVAITVTDSGPGIPAGVRERIMEPFFTTKQVGKGTGLGLSISKGIVENHGGELLLDSTGAHTCFVVRLPKPESAAPKIPPWRQSSAA